MGVHADDADDAEAQRIRVLVGDDDLALLELVSTSLRFAGYHVDTGTCAREVLAAVERRRPDLLILDATLPDQHAIDVTRQLRLRGTKTPMLLLISHRSGREHLAGLSVLGDDHLVKPFCLDELRARVRTALRRAGHPTALGSDHRHLRLADLELDQDTRETFRAGCPIRLTPTEFALLRYLMLNAGQAMSRAQILDQVWPYDFDGDGRIVESYICTLRRKVDRGRPPLIHTLYGFGYVLRSARGLFNSG